MDEHTRRLRIEDKLTLGDLPAQPFPRVSSGPGDGEPCGGCDEPTDRGGLVMGGVDILGRAVQMHVGCFLLWDAARSGGGRAAAARA